MNRQTDEWRGYACAALIASGTSEIATIDRTGPWSDDDARARWCVGLADAMVKARQGADARDAKERP